VGGTETRAWTFAGGLARTGRCEVSIVVRTGKRRNPFQRNDVEVIPRVDRLYSLYESVGRCLERTPRFPGLRMRRWEWPLLWKVPVLAICRMLETGRRDPWRADPFYTRLPADLFCTFGVQSNSARVIAAAHATGRKAVLMIGSDGDRITDIGVFGFSPDEGFARFAVLLSGGPSDRHPEGFLSQPFGGPEDRPIASDFDGDMITDIAVYGFSPDDGFSRFAILPSEGGSAFAVPFGGPNDRPVAGDYDGGGLTDIAVFGFSPDEGFARFGILSSEGEPTRSVPFGGPDDAPVAGDFDGDGLTDIAVFGFSPANDFTRLAVQPSSGAPAFLLKFEVPS